MKTKKKILIYGGSGLLGSEIIKQFSSEYLLLFPSHRQLDLTDKSKVANHLKVYKPNYIIYSAGITKSANSNRYPKKTYQLNSFIPGFIADQAAKMKIPMCYISSNAVFEGSNLSFPIKEAFAPKPTSIYGKSKLSGEAAVLSASNKNIIVRMMMLYSYSYERKNDFARIILNSLKNNKSTAGIKDQFISPLFVSTAVKALRHIVDKNASGIYHLASTNQISNYEFTKQLAQIFKLNENLIYSVSLKNFLKEKDIYKSRYSCLSVGKFKKKFGEGILQTTKDDLRDLNKAINLGK